MAVTPSILYLCDGEKAECKKKHCYKETDTEDPNCCRHTSDVAHAIHFKLNRTGRIYIEEPYQEGRICKAKIPDMPMNGS